MCLLPKITVFPRIHLTLIGMNRAGYRRNGGIGFAISEPTAHVDGRTSSKFQIKDLRNQSFLEPEIKRLYDVLSLAHSELSLPHAVSFEISGKMPTHCGFGSTTAIRLACLEILLLLNDYESTPSLLRSLSRRGGTSGVGVRTYFDGGFVFDLGRKNCSAELRPSSTAELDPTVPPCLLRADLPEWAAGIVVPLLAKPLSEAEEQQFFACMQSNSQSDVERILYHAAFGVAAATIEHDYFTFASAVTAIQDCAWKRQEIGIYGTSVLHEMAEILNLGAATVAMSSLGPGLFFLAKDPGAIVAQRLKAGAASMAVVVRLRNAGRVVES